MENFSSEVQSQVDSLVQEVDALRLQKLDKDVEARLIREIEGKISDVRGGRRAAIQGVGAIEPRQ